MGEKKKGCNCGCGRCLEKVGFYVQFLSIFFFGFNYGCFDWVFCVVGQNGIFFFCF